QCGVKTMPPDTVVACSGTSSGLPAWSWRTWKVGLPGVGGYCTPDWVLTRMGEYNSPMPGARMSEDRVVRSLMSSLSWLVALMFQPVCGAEGHGDLARRQTPGQRARG